MPDDPIASLIANGPPSPFINRHRNVVQPFQRLFQVSNPSDPAVDFFAGLKLSASAIQSLIASAIADDTTLRAVGGAWSLSTAAMTDGRMIDTLQLNWTFPIDNAGVVAGFRGDPAMLQYFQCGITIERINAILLDRGLALKTSGASNGQTIAGALSTGTHGSRFAFGAMQEYVRGLHIITAPDRVIWLERASDPVLSDASVATLGAQLVRDDTLFNSALVSFGSCGVIFGVLIEAEPVYLLELWRRRLPVDDNLKQAMRALDFSGISMPYPAEQPLHFEVVINPHDVAGGAYVTTMYRRDYPGPAGYDHPFTAAGGIGPGDDAVAFIGKVGDLLGSTLVGPAVNFVVGQEYPLYDNGNVVRGTPGEIFNTNTTFQKDLSSEIGIALEDSVRAFQTLVSLPQVSDYPGLLAFRFVKGSPALLAFTKFPTTCTIELPAAFSDSTIAYYNAAWKALDDAGIPCTFHWGQLGDFTPDRVRRMYGAACDAWMNSRSQLLSPQARAVFSNAFLRQCGLA